MCTKVELAEMTREIVSLYENVYGEDLVDVYLYGSYARGDYSDQSDVDFVAIVHGDRRSLQEKLRTVWDVSSEIGQNYSVVISPTVIPYDEFETWRTRLPYYQNIITEGLQVG